MQQQIHHKEFAVLYRTNSQSRAIEDALRKRNIPYRIYGGLSFYQRKEIKDVLAYLRLITNPKDEEALNRIINFPTRGIGQTTLSKLTVAANHYKRSIFEVIKNIDKIDLKINAGTTQKLQDFITLIESFQIINKDADAFTITDQVIKKTGLLQELKKDATPESVTRIENIEELLNGIKDFVEGQQEVADVTGSLSEFLEDVALATDMDKANANENAVALMTIHLAKGLEFPYVYIVGMEENLFPSALSMNTREELEEERRLFYVALTRAEKQIYITYAQHRYRWGELMDAEPSRFIEEIDANYLHYITPKTTPQQKFTPNTSIFDANPSKNNRFKPKTIQKQPAVTPKNLKKLTPASSNGNTTTRNYNLSVGNMVKHDRFGQGKVLTIEGSGNDVKAAIDFQNNGIKKLLLRFAKLTVVS